MDKAVPTISGPDLAATRQVCQCYRALVRSWLLRIVAVALLLGLPPALRVERTLACSCDVPTPQEAHQIADIVVAGRAVRLHTPGPGESNDASDNAWELKIFVVWKGHPYETIWVRADYLCDVGLSEDREYVVYGVVDPRDEGTVFSSVCTGTRSLHSLGNWLGGDYLRPLGEGQPPEPGTAGPKPSWLKAAADTAVPSWAIGLMAVGAVILAGGGVVARRRRGGLGYASLERFSRRE